MSRLTLTRLGAFPLEPRLAPSAGMPSATMAAADEPNVAVTGADTVRAGGRLVLTVAVTAECPACLLRAAGVVRPAGGGITEVRFSVRPGMTLDVEMAEPGGDFRPVWRVQLGRDGDVVHQSAMSPMEQAGMGDDGMAMPMTGDMAGGMTSHAADTGSAAGHGERAAAHTPMPMAAHVAPMPPHTAVANMIPMGGHRADMNSASTEGHSAEGPGLLAEPEDGHADRMMSDRRPPATQFNDEPEPVRMEADPPILVPVLAPSSADTSSPDEATEDGWSLVLGGAAVTATLVVASQVVERQARRTAVRRVVIRPPAFRPRGVSRPRPLVDEDAGFGIAGPEAGRLQPVGG